MARAHLWSRATKRLTRIYLASSSEDQGALAVSCSPTASKVAFHKDGFIYSLKLDGTGLKRLQPGYSLPTWSPDGSKIAFYHEPSGWSVMNANGTDVRPLNCQCGIEHGAWSPDGSMVAYSGSDGGIYTVNLDGSGGTRAAYRPGTQFHSPLWRPKG